VAALAAVTAVHSRAQGCDLCAIYTTVELREEQTGLRVGLAEQFTYFHTLKDDGVTVPNPDGERLASSITQLMVGYNFLSDLGAQLNLPIIARDYRRVEVGGVVDGDEEGIGDMSLLANYTPLRWADLEIVAHLTVLGGLKFPTGNPDRLKEEEQETEPCIPFPDPEACAHRHGARIRPHHGPNDPPSGIHGHDLALGSGSVDGVVGAQTFGSWRRLFATASVQYLARTEGAFGYQYANDLLFNAGPGFYLLLGDNWLGEAYALRAQVLLSGETKGSDSLDGEPVGDTGFTGLYLGPVFGFTWGTSLAADIAAELPVLQNTAQLQIVPDYRLRGGVTWRF
jgi:hypothetical protein